MEQNDTRSLEILDAVVRLNIETGRAVSSGLVERFLTRSVSSATIRTVMKNLEDAGYLDQPHTSAGRLPTDAGYRVYVDRLRAGWTLRSWSPPALLRRQVQEEIRRSLGNANQLKILAGILSRLSDSMGIVMGPSWNTVRAVRVEVYPRSSRQALIVIILENAQVRTGLVELGESVAEAVIHEASLLLTERVKGMTVGQIRRGDLAAPDLVRSPISRCAFHLAGQGQVICDGLEEEGVELGGLQNVLEEPEFLESGPLKELIRFIGSPVNIRQSLDRLDKEAGDGLGIWIGQENPLDRLRGFSIMTRRFDLDGRPGLLAVLGPRRMAFLRALQGIDMVRQVVGEETGSVIN